ncbi:HAMP domain-containing sensor histidine kinase [Paenibacillus sp. JCM 10914]|uniref:sensor histidine kinase n=1 Tax=Paenibacillus sp. JCM 10914 TaxID=1236974 RepID=UPI00068EE301|nr:HAMP domain-containing sensor histidine kinase [Paenibacillus sp. JCM 10914]
MNKPRSIKNAFARHFVWILVCSLLATLVTWGLLFMLLNYLLQRDIVLPANHYEGHIPVISEYVRTQGDSVISHRGQAALEKMIPSEGMSYHVISLSGDKLYGDLELPSPPNKAEILERLNQSYPGMNQIIKYLPVISGDGDLLGALLLGYNLKVRSANPAFDPWVSYGFLPFLLTPFLYIVLFTFLFGRRFSRKISAPLQQLLYGAERIKDRDLQFSLTESGAIAEVDQLTHAFEDMRRELEHSMKREWGLEQERSTMFAALAHDLRTPLTIIQGHVEGLEHMHGDHAESKYIQYLQVIKRNTARASNLLQDMNMIAEIEKVSFRLRPLPVDIAEFIEDKAMEYTALCRDRSITFLTEYKDDRSVSDQPVVFDPYRIIQVLDNLVSNSIRYTPDAGQIIWVIEITDQQVMMAVQDNGSGFDKPHIERVFQPFYQGGSRSVRQKGHSGLGLYIAQLLVQRHGGKIAAANNPQVGATVKFTIPIQETLGCENITMASPRSC